MEEEFKEKCGFLLSKIGELPFAEIKKHLESCQNCKKELEEHYLDYCFYYSSDPPRNPIPTMNSFFDWESIPKNLDWEEFLKKWGLVTARNREAYEHFYEQLIEKMASPEGLRILILLFSRQSRAFELLYLLRDMKKTQKIINFDHSFRGIEESYRSLRSFLGKNEFLQLMNMKDEEEFEIMLQGIEKALVTKDDQ